METSSENSLKSLKKAVGRERYYPLSPPTTMTTLNSKIIVSDGSEKMGERFSKGPSKASFPSSLCVLFCSRKPNIVFLSLKTESKPCPVLLVCSDCR